MAYESDKPVQFCFKFARSVDLSKWEKIPGLVFTGEKKEYSACPVIRYIEPFYYVIYLHAPAQRAQWLDFVSDPIQRSGKLGIKPVLIQYWKLKLVREKITRMWISSNTEEKPIYIMPQAIRRPGEPFV